MRGASALCVLALCGCSSDDTGETSGGVEQLPSTDEWRSLGYDAHNTRHNRGEKTLNAGNVASLKPKWLIHDVTIGVTSTPAVVDGVVYFGDWGGNLRAVSADSGSELWRAPVRGRPKASPLVTEDRVYVSSGREVFAFRRDTGAELWAKVLDEHPSINLDSSPIWVDGRIVVGVSSFELGVLKDDYTFRGSVVALDADQGTELWRVWVSQDDATSGAGVSVWSSAAVDRSRRLVFIGTGNTYEQPASPRSDALLAIAYETGEVRWVTQFTEGDVFTVPRLGPGPDADIGSSPNLFRIDGRDVVGAGSKAGHYKVLDRDTGDVVWEVTVGSGSPLGGIMTTSAVDDGHVYVSSNKSGGSVTSALSRTDGSLAWELDLPSSAYGALTLANGVLYQPTILGVVYAIDAARGNVLWSADMKTDCAGGISVVGGTVYVPRGFEFLSATIKAGGGLVAFSLDGSAELDFPRDAGTDTGTDAGPITPAECNAAAPSTLTAACRECACACDPTAAGGCNAACWEMFQCVVDSCAAAFSGGDAGDAGEAGEAGDGLACVKQRCTDAKLVPPEVAEATLRAAACMVQCTGDC